MNDEPRVKQETIETAEFDVITVTLWSGRQILAALEFDRLADDKPRITFSSHGSTTICDAA